MRRVRKSETQLKAMAVEMSQIIYDRGDHITKRKATPEERNILFKIFYGALLELNRNLDAHDVHTWTYAIQNTAESTADLFLPYMNGYDTVFNQLGAALRTWECE